MHKRLLLLAALAMFGATHSAQAQLGLMRMTVRSARLAGNSATLASRAGRNGKAGPATETYQGQQYPMLRTSVDQLPKKGAEQVVALETELERSHAALLASPTGLLYTPEQFAALQAALLNLAKVHPDNMRPYQQEANFYLVENTRRQQAAPATPAPAGN